MECLKVAVRIRPMIKSEISRNCKSCVEKTSNESQVVLGAQKQLFSFNYVFDEKDDQEVIYNSCTKHLIKKLFDGYNVTILAYGQTGSGKTYTMGTNYSGETNLGIIPRSINEIFDIINKELKEYNSQVTVSFLEVYNENLYDLLSNRRREDSTVDIRDHSVVGLSYIPVTCSEDALQKLREGSTGRIVGQTAMNDESSRSHSIFTLNIRMVCKDYPENLKTAKFHLVDLAGSERQKKSGASGERLKEGIHINKGLLVLGNVISALGDGNLYVNYRDSKLTRLLQDSLGGNSVTLMIACISPADYNYDETLSTLRYADRARKIKNKPIVNEDPVAAEVSRLRKENEELRSFHYKNKICPNREQELSEENALITEKLQSFYLFYKELIEKLVKLFETTQDVKSSNLLRGLLMQILKFYKGDPFALKRMKMDNNETRDNSAESFHSMMNLLQQILNCDNRDCIIKKVKLEIQRRIMEIENSEAFDENDDEENKKRKSGVE